MIKIGNIMILSSKKVPYYKTQLALRDKEIRRKQETIKNLEERVETLESIAGNANFDLTQMAKYTYPGTQCLFCINGDEKEKGNIDCETDCCFVWRGLVDRDKPVYNRRIKITPTNIHGTMGWCPNCDAKVHDALNCCHECGAALDWSHEE